MHNLGFKDVFITPILLIIIYVGALAFSTRFYAGSSIQKYFIPGLLVKLFGGIATVLIYESYYGGGDMTYYFNDGSYIFHLFSSDPIAGFKLLFQGAKHIDADTFQYTPYLHHWDDAGGYMVGRFVAIFSIFTFNTYTAVAVLFALVSFTGVWAMFITLRSIRPELEREFAIATLFIPSVFFWGSGILKDTITFGCLGWLTYASYNLFIARKQIFTSIILLMLMAYLILDVKGYIILSFIPGVVFWFCFFYIGKIHSDLLRNFLKPFVIVVAFLLGFVILNSIGGSLTRFSTTNFVQVAETYQISQSYQQPGEETSAYTLNYTPTTLGLLKVFPAAVNVTLFRPYLWEVRNPVMLLSAVESLLIFLLFLRVLIRTRISGFFYQLVNNPLAVFCMIFSILFAFAVGFSAYNFGSLVRYKIPCIPFFVAGLFLIEHEEKARKSA